MLKGFAPIIAKQPRVMILGSMPSVTSLEKQEYYGFAHNRFWNCLLYTSIVMMLGENGSGKTTLMKAMLDKLPFVQGDILWKQESLRKLNEKQRAACFSYVPQIKEMVTDIKVMDCIVAGCTRRLSLFEVPDAKEYAK